MIEDKELSALFQAECEEHLQSLDEGLLRLEAMPGDGPTLESVFRAAHSLKGTARMLGVDGVETLAHHFEDALGAARRGAALPSPVIDRLYRGLDALHKLVHEAVTGEPSGVDVAAALARLTGEAPVEEPATEEPITVEPAAEEPVAIALPAASQVDVTAPEEDVASVPAMVEAVEAAPIIVEPPIAVTATVELAPEPVEAIITAPSIETAIVEAPRVETIIATTSSAEASVAETSVAGTSVAETSVVDVPAAGSAGAAFKIETMRVDPGRLDALMTLAGELTVTTTRVTRGLSQWGEIHALWEEWSRDANRQKFVPGDDGDALRRRDMARLERLGMLLQQVRQSALDDAMRLSAMASDLEDGIQSVRLLPLSTIFNLFPRMVRDLSRSQAKDVEFVVEGAETRADKRILEELKDPLMHIMRNSIDHGIETPVERERAGKPGRATLRLRAFQTSSNIVVEVGDDGHGLNLDAIKRTAIKRRLTSEHELAAMTRDQVEALIFSPGFSTSPMVTDVSGRGVGLDVVRANVEKLKGSIFIDSEPGRGCTFRIQLPSTLTTTRVLLLEAGGYTYALPVEWVQNSLPIAPDQIASIEGRATIAVDGQPVSVVYLPELLELGSAPSGAERAGGGRNGERSRPCIVLAIGEDRLGLLVDNLVDEQEIILKPLGALLKRVRNVAGATIMGTGDVCMVLNPHDLLKSVRTRAFAPRAAASTEAAPRRKSVLLAEDSITTRTQEKRILEAAGYEVVTAVDGLEAWNKLGTRPFDAVVSDVEMPNLDGLSLAARIRSEGKYQELPIILVTSLASDEDKRRGVDVGADAYITKGTFDQSALLDALGRLI